MIRLGRPLSLAWAKSRAASSAPAPS